MLIIADHRLPEEAKQKLQKMGEVMWLKTSNIVYEAISGHPDIFFTQICKQFVVSPNTPKEFLEFLDQHNIYYVLGEEGVGEKYPQSSKYNVVADDDFLIHNFRNTDSLITKIGEDLDLIHVDQGYTRCNLIPLGNKKYICSDKGITKTLNRYEVEVIYVDPQQILLPGFQHGFIGGCAGVHEQKLYLTGSLQYLAEGEKVHEFIEAQNLEIVELYNGPLFDGGSLIFIEARS